MAVRRERVVLDLEGNFETKALRDAAAIKLLKSQIDDLSGRATRSRRPLQDAERDLDNLGKSANRNGAEIDKLSGRMRILGDALAVFGPTLSPLTAAGAGLLAGLTSELGVAVAGVGVAVLAFHGMSDSLKALNDYRLEPTAQNLQKVNEAMASLTPAGRDFARTLSGLMPSIERLQASAQSGLFPGLTDALTTIRSRGPEVNAIIAELSAAMGELAKEGAQAIASPKWDAWFAAFESQAKPMMMDLGHALGNVASSAANLWVAFTPFSRDFSSGLVKATKDLDGWTAGLAKSQGFQEFVAYIEKSGPEVLHTLGSISDMFVKIGTAMAPLGGPALKLLSTLANAVGNIAGSDIGTPIFAALGAMALFNRSMQAAEKLQMLTFGGPAVARIKGWGASLTVMGRDLSTVTTGLRSTPEDIRNLSAANARLAGSFKSFGKGAALVGGLAVASSGLGDKLGVTNTATLGLTSAMLGFNPIVGGLAGLFLDANSAASKLESTFNDMSDARDIETLTSRYNSLKGQLYDLDHTRPGDWGDAWHDTLTELGLGIKQIFGGQGEGAMSRGLQDAKTKIDHLTGSQRLAAAAAGAYGTRQQAAAKATIIARNAAAETAQSFIGLGKDVNNSKVSLDAWIHQMQRSANALVAFGNNAATAAKRGLADGLIKELEQAGPAGALRMKQLADGTAGQIARANKSWAAGQAAIERYQRTVAGTPKSVTTTLALSDASAMVAIQRIKSELAHIPRSISTQYFVTQTTRINKPRSTPGNPGGSADGSTVPKLGPYTDRYPYLLAPGEEVISNRHGQADRHRALLKAINAGRLADGGTVTKKKKPNVLTQAEFNQAAYAFDLSLPMTIRQIDNEFHSLATTIHRDSGHLSDALGKLRKSAIGLVDPFSRASNRLSTARSEKSSAISTAMGSFNNDLFSGSLGDFLTGAHADINDITGMMAAIGKAKKKGLSGPLAAALEGSGNVALAQQFAGASRSQISYYEHLFANRANDQALLGKQAGSFYDPAIGKLSDEVAHLRHAANQMEKAAQAQIAAANKLPHAVERGSENGTRKGNDARDKRGANRRKTR